MKHVDDYDHGFPPPYEATLPRSERGTISVAIGLLTVFLQAVVFSVMWQVLRSFWQGRSSFSEMMSIVSPAMRLIAALLALVGLAFGILGLLQSDRRKELPVVGTILNGLILIGQLLSAAMPVMLKIFGGFR